MREKGGDRRDGKWGNEWANGGICAIGLRGWTTLIVDDNLAYLIILSYGLHSFWGRTVPQHSRPTVLRCAPVPKMKSRRL